MQDAINEFKGTSEEVRYVSCSMIYSMYRLHAVVYIPRIVYL